MADRRPVVRAPDAAWKRLGELLQLRRAELGHKRRPSFTRDRGINIRLVTDIENAYRPNTFLTPTLREIAMAYQVTYDSMLAVLAGKADGLAGDGDAAPRQPPVTDPLALPPSPFGDLARDAANHPWALVIWKRYLDLPRRVTDPSGAEMFPGEPEDAKAWDGIRGLPLGDRVHVLADMRRRAAGGGAPGAGTGTAGVLTSQLVRTPGGFARFARDDRHGSRMHPP